MEKQNLVEQAGDLMGRLSAEIMKYSSRDTLRLIQREGLSMPRMVTLMFVARFGSVTISAVRDHLNLALGTTSQIIDQLVIDGYLERHESHEDRRHKHVTLTERGRQFVAEVHRIRAVELTQRLTALPDTLLEQVIVVMGEVVTHLEAERPGEQECRTVAETG